MLKPTDIKTGVAYDYNMDGEPKMGVINGIDKGIILMDNGDQISFKNFMAIGSVVNTSESHNEEIPTTTSDKNDMSDIIVMPSVIDKMIKFDKDGNPILQTEDQSNQKLVEKTILRKPVLDPILELVKGSKKETQKLGLPCEIEIISTAMMNLLKENYGDKTPDKIIDYLVDTFDSNNLKNILKGELKKHYSIL